MTPFSKITESPSLHDNLESLSAAEILQKMNEEDQKVALAVRVCIPEITQLVSGLEPRFLSGGRLFYIGAGTSGRLGILDASEIPPTYGFPHERVVGIMAGGDVAIRKSVEHAEDDIEQAWKDLQAHNIGPLDTVVGIAASGTTPYVLGGIKKAREAGILTAGVTNNPGSPLTEVAEIAIAINVGPEFVTGSTRMKSGTSQKLVLNMISTALMIRIGRVQGNRMVHMQLTNSKLVDRGTRYIVESLGLSYEEAQAAVTKYGSVQKTLEALG